MRQIAGYIFISNNRSHCLQQVLVKLVVFVTGVFIANTKSSIVDGNHSIIIYFLFQTIIIISIQTIIPAQLQELN